MKYLRVMKLKINDIIPDFLKFNSTRNDSKVFIMPSIKLTAWPNVASLF